MTASRVSLLVTFVLCVSLALFLSSAAAASCSQQQCRTGFLYQQLPGFNFTTNGCGSYGVDVNAYVHLPHTPLHHPPHIPLTRLPLTPPLPPSPAHAWRRPFGVDPCCASHDYCYSNCSTTKAACDSQFDACMKAVCSNETQPEQDACDVEADAFYTAVMDLGCDAYESAQDQGCECSNGTSVYFLSAAAGGREASSGGLVQVVVAVMSAVLLWVL